MQSRPLDVSALLSPLPRAYEWVDGSAYLNHVILVRKARNAEPPPTLETDPLVYQGGSGDLARRPREDIPLVDEAWGLDFESEVCVILGDVPLGTQAADAEQARAAGDALPTTSPCATSSPTSWPRASASSRASRRPRSRPSRSPRRARRRVAGRPRPPAPALHAQRRRWSATRDAGPEMHFSFFDLIQHIAQDARASPPAPSSAAAPCPTRSARAASPASPSAG